LVGRQRRQRDTGRLFKTQAFGHTCHSVSRHGHVFGESSGARDRKTRKHRIAHRKIAHFAAHFHDQAGTLVAHRLRQFIRRDHFHITARDHIVQRVHAGGLHFDQHLVRRHLWARKFHAIQGQILFVVLL